MDVQKIAEKKRVSPEIIKEWLKRFVKYAPQYIKPLDEYSREKDFEKLAVAAFKLKGAAVMIGLDSIAALSERICQQAKERQDADYPGMIDQVKTAIDAIKAEI